MYHRQALDFVSNGYSKGLWFWLGREQTIMGDVSGCNAGATCNETI